MTASKRPSTVLDTNEESDRKTDPNYRGPTVSEYAELRVAEINRTIAELTMERSRLYKLQREYQGSKTLWADKE